MSWAKVDDRANEHRKQLEAGAEACWMWTCGLMYANRQDARDGFIPELVLPMLFPFRAPKKLAARLVEVGLWERVEGGYRVHNYHEWNPTKEQVDAEREAGRRRAAESYARRHPPRKRDSSPEEIPKSEAKSEPKKHVSSGSTPLHSNPKEPIGSSLGASAPPDPPKPRPPRKWTKVPPDWAPNDAHRRLAGEQRKNIDAEAAKFRDHEFRTPKTDADAAFRNWLRSDYGGSVPAPRRGGTPTQPNYGYELQLEEITG